MFRFSLFVFTTLLLTGLAAVAQADPGGQNRNFRAHLSGDEEVPEADTLAQGQIKLKVSKDGTEIAFMLIVANVEDVTQAHIHLAPEGMNGPIVAWLYPSGPPAMLIEGRSSGILAVGFITEEDLVGPLAGMTIDELVMAIRMGLTYVNVHTLNFPGGEIRGQIVD